MDDSRTVKNLPPKALSVRQPWAWAIIHGGKDIENRACRVASNSARHKNIAIHAAKGMTRFEYEAASALMLKIGVDCPQPDQLLRGGIVGSVAIKGVVKHSQSPWFFGPMGLVLENPKPCDFISSTGALGFFDWKQNPGGIAAEPAKWMSNYCGSEPGALCGKDGCAGHLENADLACCICPASPCAACNVDAYLYCPECFREVRS